MLKGKHLALITTILVMLFFYFPLVWMVVMSFLGKVEGKYVWTLSWYDEVFHRDDILRLIGNTAFIGLSASVISTILGTLSALALYKYRSKLQEIHLGLLYVPLVLPEILMGLSLMIFFSEIHAPFGRGTVIAAHVAFCTSYVTVVISSSLDGFDFTLVEAARDLGATYFQSFMKVIFPLLRPAILAGTLLAFTLSLDDFIVTFFVRGHGDTTLPVFIYNSFGKHGKVEVIYALSSLLLAVTFILVTISLFFTNNTQLLEGGENKA